jgi:hypothetical protein
MPKTMRSTLFTIVLGAAALALATGCNTTTQTQKVPPAKTGFLSTYRHLEPTSDASLSYLDPNNRLARYHRFIILPVESRLYSGQTEVSAEDMEAIAQYLKEALARELSRDYEVVTAPTGHTAEVRIAITDVQKSTPIINVIPRPKLVDLGLLGALSMEGEVLDSVSAVQILALIESRTGQNRMIDFSRLDDSKAVMDHWARRFRELVDEAHAKAGH